MKKALFVLPLLLFAVLALAQERNVSGIITSADDRQPVIGATVLVKGTSIGTATDLDGSFSLRVSGNDAVLVVSYTGFKTIEVAVGSRTDLNIVLESSVAFLDEVVVTGYGSQGRRVLTSAISS
ncbi:MAG TPA: carboxypeptidase-like regulatory domain-containing protein, partial [Saprospiraceae bacterium]|nr:carboxypeptidase-like regulatory domain-containing protein [Saprospiraceae bacterium]